MHRNVTLLAAHNFLNDFRFQEAFLVIYFAQISGSYTAAMTVLALFSLSEAVFQIPTGIFSDKMGRKRTFFLGSICSTLGVACYAFAHGMGMLALGGILLGEARAFFGANNDAFLYETLKEDNKEQEFHHYQGKVNGMYQLALGLSALTASLIVKQDLRFLFMLGIVPQLLTVLVSLFFHEPKVHIPSTRGHFSHFMESFKHIWKNPRLRLLAFAQSLSYGYGETSFNYNMTFIGTLWPTWALGLYRAINHGLGFIGCWFAGRTVQRFKGAKMLIISEVW